MASRRGHGEGSIYQRESDGRWCCAVNLGFVFDKAAGKPIRKQKYVYGKTRKEVAEKLKVLLRDQQQGIPIASDRQTVAQFLTRWLAEVVKPNLRPKTYRSYEQNVRLYLIPALGRHQLTKLEPQHVQAMLNAQREAGMAPETVRRMRDVLRNALNQAIEWNHIPRNAAERVKVPGGASGDKTALTPEQAAQFLTAARGHRLEALFSVAVSLGMRQGEILGLTWDTVDLDAGTLRVAANLQRVDGTFVVGDPKSAQGKRTIDLPAPLVRSLRAHRARQNEMRLATGEKWQDRGLVFCTKFGNPFDGPNITKYTQAVLRKAGLPIVTFHELRHSCASILAAQGIPAYEVSRLLGHSDVRLTLNTYTHAFDAGRRRVADAMDGLFGPSWSSETYSASEK